MFVTKQDDNSTLAISTTSFVTTWLGKPSLSLSKYYNTRSHKSTSCWDNVAIKHSYENDQVNFLFSLRSCCDVLSSPSNKNPHSRVPVIPHRPRPKVVQIHLI